MQKSVEVVLKKFCSILWNLLTFYATVNTEMLSLYWNIGKAIMEIQQGDERASYGETVLEKLSQKLTAEFGKGFSKRNLERMRKFYIYFPIATTVSSQLSWSHYLDKENEKKIKKLKSAE